MERAAFKRLAISSILKFSKVFLEVSKVHSSNGGGGVVTSEERVPLFFSCHHVGDSPQPPQQPYCYGLCLVAGLSGLCLGCVWGWGVAGVWLGCGLGLGLGVVALGV